VNFLFKCFLVKKRKGKRKKEKENCRRRRCDSRERKSLSRCRRQVLLNWNTNDSSNCILLHLTPRPPPHGSSRAHNTSTASTRSLYIQCLRHIAFHIPTHPSFSSTHYSATLMGSQSKVFLSVDWTLTSPPAPIYVYIPKFFPIFFLPFSKKREWKTNPKSTFWCVFNINPVTP
jgi:hypothetical protein